MLLPCQFAVYSTNYAFDIHIYSFSPTTAYVFPVWQTHYISSFMPIHFDIVHTVFIQNTSAHEVLSNSHMSDNLCIPSLVDILFLLIYASKF